jgi:hypothetical protein
MSPLIQHSWNNLERPDTRFLIRQVWDQASASPTLRLPSAPTPCAQKPSELIVLQELLVACLLMVAYSRQKGLKGLTGRPCCHATR